jgi:hypothetical protein
MMLAPGKFAAGAATRQISRWQFQLLEPLVFNDPEYGQITVPETFTSDLASVRVLREICRWAALAAVVLGLFLSSISWAATVLWAVAVTALALYGLVVGYGMRAAILHDWLYSTATLTRDQCDAVFSRAMHTGDGTAHWRTFLFWIAVRLGGARHYGAG